MASYSIFCPCSVELLGEARVDGDVMPYFVEPWVHAADARARCRHCGEIVRIVGCKCAMCTRPAPTPAGGRQ